ncbi:MAG TPA: TIGR03118 family protein [Candidatus Polarisedimenticolia bacterium]|jgi:uncharacterized protein (TIGR03118 family)|nr:TIGR03118 family protein [Candidatus Polarisedimenticolia bacterium]
MKSMTGLFVLLVAAALATAAIADDVYLPTDLVSDQPGVAPILDTHLVNGWGIAVPPSSGAFWVSSEGAGLSVLYSGDVGPNPLAKAPLEVSIPGGHPTGVVFNTIVGVSDFVIASGSSAAPATFIFASLAGEVTGWSPAVSQTSAQLAFQATDGAIYTGIALGNNGAGNFLYLADFHNRKIDVLNASFQVAHLAGSFTDSDLPGDYAPFNVAILGGRLHVAYAKQDADGEEEITGPHLGFIDVFDLNGNFLQRLVSQGRLNAPWAMVVAPAGFGQFSGDLLVGNFGDGRINAYDPATGAFVGTLSQSSNDPIEIDGLWGLAFGNGTTAGSATSLYYAAGPSDETHGLFGKITANPAGTSPVHAAVTGGNLVITGSRENDRIGVQMDDKTQRLLVLADEHEVGSFDPASVSRIQLLGFAGDDRFKIARDVAIPAILDGGAGNDNLSGGGGANLILGGPGDDTLLGSAGRDILIGGEGADRLRGNDEDDLLIGGSTAYDGDLTAWLAIQGEWISGESYAERVDHLRNGLEGLPKLDGTTVLDDAAKDFLSGNQGLDWFFAGPDDSLDLESGEQQN